MDKWFLEPPVHLDLLRISWTSSLAIRRGTARAATRVSSPDTAGRPLIGVRGGTRAAHIGHAAAALVCGILVAGSALLLTAYKREGNTQNQDRFFHSHCLCMFTLFNSSNADLKLGLGGRITNAVKPSFFLRGIP